MSVTQVELVDEYDDMSAAAAQWQALVT